MMISHHLRQRLVLLISIRDTNIPCTLAVDVKSRLLDNQNVYLAVFRLIDCLPLQELIKTIFLVSRKETAF